MSPSGSVRMLDCTCSEGGWGREVGNPNRVFHVFHPSDFHWGEMRERIHSSSQQIETCRNNSIFPLLPPGGRGVTYLIGEFGNWNWTVRWWPLQALSFSNLLNHRQRACWLVLPCRKTFGASFAWVGGSLQFWRMCSGKSHKSIVASQLRNILLPLLRLMLGFLFLLSLMCKLSG